MSNIKGEGNWQEWEGKKTRQAEGRYAGLDYI